MRKKKHFIKDCRLINVMNRRKLNVLQTIFVKKKFRKNVKKKSKFLKVITNDEYYRIKNIDELRQILKRKTLNNAFINTKKLTKKFNQFLKKNRWHFIWTIEKRNRTMITSITQHSNNNWTKLLKFSKQSWAMMQTYNKIVVQQNVEQCVMTMNVWNVEIEKQNTSKQL